MFHPCQSASLYRRAFLFWCASFTPGAPLVFGASLYRRAFLASCASRLHDVLQAQGTNRYAATPDAQVWVGPPVFSPLVRTSHSFSSPPSRRASRSIGVLLLESTSFAHACPPRSSCEPDLTAPYRVCYDYACIECELCHQCLSLVARASTITSRLPPPGCEPPHECLPEAVCESSSPVHSHTFGASLPTGASITRVRVPALVLSLSPSASLLIERYFPTFGASPNPDASPTERALRASPYESFPQCHSQGRREPRLECLPVQP